MTVAPSSQRRAGRLARDGVERMIDLLETDFGRVSDRAEGVAANQFLLDALDRGEYRSMTVWPLTDPTGVCYQGAGGLVVPAGRQDAGEPLAAAIRSTGWRVLVGDLTIGRSIVDEAASGIFRRRPYAREQRLMTYERHAIVDPDVRLRRATVDDLDVLTDFASGLHVEDQMGPPLSRSGRSSVRHRVAASVRRGSSWVVETHDGSVVAKVDVSIESRLRGAQLAGVYVDRRARGRGIGRRAIGALSHRLMLSGLPCVTLHVRADNVAAIRAYEAAGFARRRRWLLALR